MNNPVDEHIRHIAQFQDETGTLWDGLDLAECDNGPWTVPLDSALEQDRTVMYAQCVIDECTGRKLLKVSCEGDKDSEPANEHPLTIRAETVLVGATVTVTEPNRRLTTEEMYQRGLVI